jgi:hypothetical protein
MLWSTLIRQRAKARLKAMSSGERSFPCGLRCGIAPPVQVQVRNYDVGQIVDAANAVGHALQHYRLLSESALDPSIMLRS